MLGTKPGLDFTGHHGPVFAAFNGTCGAAFLAMLGKLFSERYPAMWLWVTAPAIFGCVCAVIDGALKDRAGFSLTYRAACWLGGGVWMSWAIHTSPWSPETLVVLAGAGLGAGMLGPQLLSMERKAKDRAAAGLFASQQVKMAIEWERRIERVTGMRDMSESVIGIERWLPPEGAPDRRSLGYTVDVQMPFGGTGWRYLQRYQDDLANDLRLGEGCGVEIFQGEDRSRALIQVTTRNALVDDQPYPRDFSPLTINNPFPVGVYPDAGTADVSLLDSCGILVGQRGSGKTNEEQVVTAQLVRCVDTVVWNIDKTGASAVPWILPFREGRADRPAIDWAARSTNEQLIMCDFAIAIIDFRKSGYVDRKRAVDDDKLPVDPEVPAIVIVVDEWAELHRTVKAKLETIINTGRGARVQVVLCALRPTADILDSVNILRQSNVRIGMKVSDMVEYDYFFGYTATKGVTEDDTPYPGCGLIKPNDTGKARKFKGYRMLPSTIDTVAVAVAGYRPALDELSARQPGGDLYAARWERAEAELFGGDPVPVAAAPAPQQQEARMDPLDNDDVLARADRAEENLRRALEDDADVLDFDAQFASIVEGVEDPEWSEPEPEGSATPDVRERAFTLLRAEGPKGAGPEEIARKLRAEGKRTVRQTVSRWFNEESRRPGGVVVNMGSGIFAHREALK